jgi:hypothetical protein
MRLIDVDALKYDLCVWHCELYDLCQAWCSTLAVINKQPVISAQPVWIPCSERLPMQLQNVIVLTDIKTVTLAWLMDDNWYFADAGSGHIEQWGLSDVTHWMPLPEPPGGERRCLMK